MKSHRLAGLNNRNLFLTSLEAGRSTIKGLANLIAGESSVLGLQMASFLLCLPVQNRGRGNSFVSLQIRTLLLSN